MNIKEAADYLHMALSEIEQLVKDRDIPFERQGERIAFRRGTLDAWASQRILTLPEKHLSAYHARTSSTVREFSPEEALMPQLLTLDRINPAMTSKTRASVIRDLVDLADKTDLLLDKTELITRVDEREQLCSTALPGGLALLHPRHHDPYMFAESFMIVGRTIQPIHFGCSDGLPTNLFFLVCCQDDRIHLHALARLCTICMKTSLLEQLRAAASRPEMLDALIRAETDILRHL